MSNRNNNNIDSREETYFDRRRFFHFAQSGLSGAALAMLMMQDGFAKELTQKKNELKKPPHHQPKAKRVLHIYFSGGLSHIDSFDYKPMLTKRHGKPLSDKDRPDVFFGKVGLLRKNDWEFKKRGKSGLWVSELFPNIATVADEMTVIKSMFADSSSHTPATFQANAGFRLNGFPVLGSWLSYGLGAETDDLPAYVVLTDERGMPAGTSANWTNGFLPAQHQGVAFRNGKNPILDLFPARKISKETEKATRDLLSQMNQQHLKQTGGDQLQARIQSYQMAAKMQLAVPTVTDLTKESKETRKMYGLERKESANFGRNCLLARRLLQKGVRMVQLFAGGSFGSPRINWDGHEDMIRNHTRESLRVDQPIAALIKDLRRLGMLKDTLVLLTSEFGRTPFTQSNANQLGKGRDHNQTGFTCIMLGAGLKSGIEYGATDEVGYKAVDKPVHWNDFPCDRACIYWESTTND